MEILYAEDAIELAEQRDKAAPKKSSKNEEVQRLFKFASYVPDFPPGILSEWAKGLNPGSPIRNLPRGWG